MFPIEARKVPDSRKLIWFIKNAAVPVVCCGDIGCIVRRNGIVMHVVAARDIFIDCPIPVRQPPQWTFNLRHELVVSRPSAPGSVVEPDEFSGVYVCPGSPQRGLSDRKENGTANHAEHAKGGGALQGQDDAFDLKARLAEVE
jgi:hypothetical protein